MWKFKFYLLFWSYHLWISVVRFLKKTHLNSKVCLVKIQNHKQTFAVWSRPSISRSETKVNGLWFAPTKFYAPKLHKTKLSTKNTTKQPFPHKFWIVFQQANDRDFVDQTKKESALCLQLLFKVDCKCRKNPVVWVGWKSVRIWTTRFVFCFQILQTEKNLWF